MYLHFTEALGRTLLFDRLVKSEQSICHTINHSLRKKRARESTCAASHTRSPSYVCQLAAYRISNVIIFVFNRLIHLTWPLIHPNQRILPLSWTAFRIWHQRVIIRHRHPEIFGQRWWPRTQIQIRVRIRRRRSGLKSARPWTGAATRQEFHFWEQPTESCVLHFV